MGTICLSYSVGVKTSCCLTYNFIFPKLNRILASCRTWKQQENAIRRSVLDLSFHSVGLVFTCLTYFNIVVNHSFL